MVIRQILHLLLIQKHSVRRKRHLDFFIVFLLLLANIGHRLLHHMPVHERFTAEKVQLAMFTVSAVGDEEINSPARHIEAHEHTPLSISSLSGKAVLAAEIAVVGGVSMKGSTLRSVLGLRSACFEWEAADGKLVFFVTGYGHGVGMSQYGANQMAKEGADYRTILTHYYTGVTVEPYTTAAMG